MRDALELVAAITLSFLIGAAVAAALVAVFVAMLVVADVIDAQPSRNATDITIPEQ